MRYAEQQQFVQLTSVLAQGRISVTAPSARLLCSIDIHGGEVILRALLAMIWLADIDSNCVFLLQRPTTSSA